MRGCSRLKTLQLLHIWEVFTTIRGDRTEPQEEPIHESVRVVVTARYSDCAHACIKGSAMLEYLHALVNPCCLQGFVSGGMIYRLTFC